MIKYPDKNHPKGKGLVFDSQLEGIVSSCLGRHGFKQGRHGNCRRKASGWSHSTDNQNTEKKQEMGLGYKLLRLASVIHSHWHGATS